MNELPLVSVGLPVYNRPEGLRRTLECFINQSYSNIEIIIADNCSPNPEVERIAREYLAKDARITYYRHDSNKGWGFNTVFVIEKAKGDFFLRATDDDWWDVTFIEKIMSKMVFTKNYSIGISNYERISESGQTLNIYGIKDHLPYLEELCTKNNLKNLSNYINQFEGFGKSNLYLGIFKTTLLKNKMVYNILNGQVLAGDLIINLYCLINGPICVINQTLFKISVENEKLYEQDTIFSRELNLLVICIDVKKIRSLFQKWWGYFKFLNEIILKSDLNFYSKSLLWFLIKKRQILFIYDLLTKNIRTQPKNIFRLFQRKYTLE